jgi:hypothetical protein
LLKKVIYIPFFTKMNLSTGGKSMTLKEQLQEDLKTALKQKDTVKLIIGGFWQCSGGSSVGLAMMDTQAIKAEGMVISERRAPKTRMYKRRA